MKIQENQEQVEFNGIHSFWSAQSFIRPKHVHCLPDKKFSTDPVKNNFLKAKTCKRNVKFVFLFGPVVYFDPKQFNNISGTIRNRCVLSEQL
jgi:hypothetical protein